MILYIQTDKKTQENAGNAMTKLLEIPENGKFTVATLHTIGGGEHFEKGGCQLTLLPNQLYRVDQSLVGLVSAEGICHVKQQSKAFGSIDKEMDILFTIDPDLDVIAYTE